MRNTMSKRMLHATPIAFTTHESAATSSRPALAVVGAMLSPARTDAAHVSKSTLEAGGFVSLVGNVSTKNCHGSTDIVRGPSTQTNETSSNSPRSDPPPQFASEMPKRKHS